MMSKVEINLKVSLNLFIRSNTKKPNPALDIKPAIAAPNDIVPLINIKVIAIDTAQFGISPIIAVITG